MTATAQIEYPTKDEETAGIGTEEGAPGEEDGSLEAIQEEVIGERSSLEANGVAVREDDDEDEPACGDSIPPGRHFDISPEEFCGDPYEQDKHLESRQELGRKGENAAVRYLKSKGYTILKRNWFCRFGEADIIARDPEDTLCFIEVKTRQSIEAGMPEESITYEKQRRYERIALAYMMVSDEWDDNDRVRFDAIGICVTEPHRALLRHHKGCFNECI